MSPPLLRTTFQLKEHVRVCKNQKRINELKAAEYLKLADKWQKDIDALQKELYRRGECQFDFARGTEEIPKGTI